jgi:hypothetical protein
MSYGTDTNSKEPNLTLLSATSSCKTSSAFPFFADVLEDPHEIKLTPIMLLGLT